MPIRFDITWFILMKSVTPKLFLYFTLSPSSLSHNLFLSYLFLYLSLSLPLFSVSSLISVTLFISRSCFPLPLHGFPQFRFYLSFSCFTFFISLLSISSSSSYAFSYYTIFFRCISFPALFSPPFFSILLVRFLLVEMRNLFRL